MSEEQNKAAVPTTQSAQAAPSAQPVQTVAQLATQQATTQVANQVEETQAPEISAESTSEIEEAKPEEKAPGFNPIKSALHGASFAAGVLSGNQEKFKIQKATGAELDKELNKVQEQSANYKDQGAIEDAKRLEKYKNTNK